MGVVCIGRWRPMGVVLQQRAFAICSLHYYPLDCSKQVPLRWRVCPHLIVCRGPLCLALILGGRRLQAKSSCTGVYPVHRCTALHYYVSSWC
jgi:hypothetical protein